MLMSEAFAKVNIVVSAKPVAMTTDDPAKEKAERSFNWKVSRKAEPKQLWLAAIADVKPLKNKK